MYTQTSLIYEALMLLFGIISIIVNFIFFLCIYRVRAPYLKRTAINLLHIGLIEMCISIFVMLMQPKLYSTENLYFFILQGPIRFLSLGIGNMILYDVYLALFYTRIFVYTLVFIFSFVNFKSSVCSLSSLVVFISLGTLITFGLIFDIFYKCQAYEEYFIYEARSHNIDLDYVDSYGHFRVNWHSKDNCPLTFAIGYAAIVACCLWIPLYLLYKKINPAITPTGFVPKYKQKFEIEKSKLITILSIIRFSVLTPSIGIYLFYEPASSNDTLLVGTNIVIYLLPLTLSIINPILSILMIRPYRLYFFSNILKSTVHNNLNISVVYHTSN